MIKKFFVLLIGLFLIVGIVMAQGITQDENEPLGYINYLEGSSGKILSQDFLGEAEINMLILQGDELRSKHSRIEVCLTKIGYIRLDYNTVVEFTILEEELAMLTILRGNVYIRAISRIGIETFNKSFNLEPGLYRIEVTDKTKVYKNPILMYEDEFDKWNYRREKEINHPNQYLPEKYIVSLRYYGSWQWDLAYGWIWVLRRSYWGLRYSYWPWSFSYGRWYRSAAWGWYWIPTRHWGPGWIDRSWNKDRLRSRNIVKHVISKDQLKKKVPKIINTNTTRSISKLKTQTSLTRFRKIYSPISRKTYSPRISSRSSIFSKSISPSRSLSRSRLQSRPVPAKPKRIRKK